MDCCDVKWELQVKLKFNENVTHRAVLPTVWMCFTECFNRTVSTLKVWVYSELTASLVYGWSIRLPIKRSKSVIELFWLNKCLITARNLESGVWNNMPRRARKDVDPAPDFCLVVLVTRPIIMRGNEHRVHLWTTYLCTIKSST